MEMRLITAHLLWRYDLSMDTTKHEAANRVWGTEGRMARMKIFHSMTKPDLWVNLTKRCFQV